MAHMTGNNRSRMETKMASLSMTPPTREAVEAFRRDVVEASLSQLVLLRFTASWCGPCKQMAPAIDRVVAQAPEGKVKQVVVDIDQEGWIAEQFRVQSVPTVYALLGGQPVDGFVGARSEREIKAFVDKLLAQVPAGDADAEAELAAIVTQGNQLLSEGKAGEAAQLFGALVQQLPDRVDVVTGYARALLALGQVAGAEAAMATLPDDASDPAISQVRTAIELARTPVASAEQEALEAKVQADPDDHDSRLALASILFAAGQRDAAADQLLASIAADREWNEGAARAQLLKFIEAVGVGDAWSVGIRRKLSSILFA